MSKQTKRMMLRISRAGVLFLLVGFLLAMPCYSKEVPKGQATIVLNELFITNGGDCHTSQGGGAILIDNLIHEGLIRKTSDGVFAPALAKSWEFSKDGLTMKFTLDERAKFHNGEPVTARDVKFSIERAMRPELKFVKGGELRRNIDRIEIIDDHRLNVHTKSPYPGFFEASVAYLGIVPKSYVEKVGDQEFAKHPVGAGPFKWVNYQQDVSITAEAFEDHYRKVPSVKTLYFKFLTEDATILSMFKAGEADIVQLPVSTYKEVKNDPKFRIVWSKYILGPTLVFCDLAFPEVPSPFHDVRVRRAVSYAINRNAICEKLLYGCAEPWGDLFAPYHAGFDPNVKPYSYDPEKARTLLKEAGYPNGFDTTFTYGLLGDKTEVQAMASDLGKVGIRAKLVEYESGTYIRMWAEKKFHGLARGITPFWMGQSHPGPGTETLISSATFWPYVTKPETEAVWKKLCGLVDQKAIAAQAKELSQVWRGSEIRYMLWAVHQPFGLSPRIKSYHPTPGVKQVRCLEYLELNE